MTTRTYSGEDRLGLGFPGWRTWRGVHPSLLYAWRAGTSPPIIVRARDMHTLAALVAELHEAPWAHRHYFERGHDYWNR